MPEAVARRWCRTRIGRSAMALAEVPVLVKSADCWIRMEDFGSSCCTNGNGRQCGNPAKCAFCLAVSWKLELAKAEGCAHLLTAMGSEMAHMIRTDMSHKEIAAVMAEILLKGHLTNGESMGKVRKDLSHFGWVIIAPAIATRMASEGALSHVVPQMVSTSTTALFRCREDMGNSHYAAWLKNVILPISECGKTHYNTEHVGDAVEAMLGLCFVMDAVCGMIKSNGCIGTGDDFGIMFSTENFADWLCEQLRAYTIPSARDALAAALRASTSPEGPPEGKKEEGAASTLGAHGFAVQKELPMRASGASGSEQRPVARNLFGGPPSDAKEISKIADNLLGAAGGGGLSYYGGNFTGCTPTPSQSDIVEQAILNSNRVLEKYGRCREALEQAVGHINRLEAFITPVMDIMTQMQLGLTSVQAVDVPPPFVVPEEFAVAMDEEDLAQQVSDRQHSRAAMPQGLEGTARESAPVEKPAGMGDATAPEEHVTQKAPEDAAAGAAEATAATAVATTATAAATAAPTAYPRQMDIRARKAQRKVGLTFISIGEIPSSEAPTDEGFENFLKLVKRDADYGGDVSEPEKADEEVHNLLVTRLMAIMRHGSPLIPNPMWHYFAPLGRILSVIQQHKDFKDNVDINENQVLCALMTADCYASAPGTPYFQTLSIIKDGVRMVFARADPNNAHVVHTINSEGFRLAGTPYKQGGAKKGGKGAPYQQQPAGNSGQGWVNRGASSNNSWWKTEDTWAATGKDPWNSPPAK
jgi:hypothetical protein